MDLDLDLDLGVHLDPYKKNYISYRFSCFVDQNVEKSLMCFALSIQKWSFDLKFASQVIILRGVVESGFSKSTFFCQPGDAAELTGTAHVTSSFLIIQKQNPKC